MITLSSNLDLSIMYKSFLAISVLGFGTVANPVHAVSFYNFSFTGTGSSQTISGSGSFTTNDLPNGATASTSVLITGITGTITDSGTGNTSRNISALLAPGTFGGNDNLLRPLALDPNKVNNNGVSFTVLDTTSVSIPNFDSNYNLFFDSVSSKYLISSTNFDNIRFTEDTFNTLNLTATPIPFEFNPTLGIGILGGVWLVRKRLKKKV
jgi:hypothetical protein